MKQAGKRRVNAGQKHKLYKTQGKGTWTSRELLHSIAEQVLCCVCVCVCVLRALEVKKILAIEQRGSIKLCSLFDDAVLEADRRWPCMCFKFAQFGDKMIVC